jgi:hypothetical protein
VNWRGWARQPLVHFLLGGLAIFALFAWRGEPADPASRAIRLTREDQAQLALGVERMMGRAPDQGELDSLIERWVHDEVLYREALRLGLEQDDPVIRRRLAQKMDILAASAAETETPSDAQLQKWLEQHPDRFTPDTALSLDQLYFGERAAAAAALGRLRGGANWRELGEPVTLPRSLAATSRTVVSDQFGAQFARAVERIEPGAGWHGPIETPLGWHLVRLRARTVGALPSLASVRGRVEDDWRTETERARKEAGYRVLRDAYSVVIDR